MATALDQQEQLNRILASSVAPVYSYNQGVVNAAALGSDQRFRQQIADEANARALEQTQIQADAHIKGIEAQTKAYMDRLSEQERQAQFKKFLQAGIIRPQGMTDDEYQTYASEKLAKLLTLHDTNIDALQKEAVKLAAGGDQAREVFARDAGLRALQAQMDPKMFSVVAPLVRSGVSVEDALSQARTRATFLGLPLWTRELKPSELQGFTAAYNTASEAAYEKPVVKDELRMKVDVVRGELQKALAMRAKFAEEFPGAALNQAANFKPAALLDLDKIAAIKSAQASGFIGPTIPAGVKVPQRGPVVPVVPSAPATGVIPSAFRAAGDVAGSILPSGADLAQALAPVAAGSRNLYNVLWSGAPVESMSPSPTRAQVDAYRQRVLADQAAAFGTPAIAPVIQPMAPQPTSLSPMFPATRISASPFPYSPAQPPPALTPEQADALMRSIAPVAGYY